MQTYKKQKIVGQTAYTNPATGEVVPFQIISIDDKDFNFHKLWLQNFVIATEDIRNVKMDLVLWIIDNLDKENKLVKTQRQMAEQSHVALSTVQRTIKALLSSTPPFLQKINSGAYRVNPDIIWKGSYSNRMGQIYEFNKEENK